MKLSSWRVLLASHALVWAVLAVMAYVTAGPYTFASCWLIFPFTFLRASRLTNDARAVPGCSRRFFLYRSKPAFRCPVEPPRRPGRLHAPLRLLAALLLCSPRCRRSCGLLNRYPCGPSHCTAVLKHLLDGFGVPHRVRTAGTRVGRRHEPAERPWGAGSISPQTASPPKTGSRGTLSRSRAAVGHGAGGRCREGSVSVPKETDLLSRMKATHSQTRAHLDRIACQIPARGERMTTTAKAQARRHPRG